MPNPSALYRYQGPNPTFFVDDVTVPAAGPVPLKPSNKNGFWGLDGFYQEITFSSPNDLSGITITFEGDDLWGFRKQYSRTGPTANIIRYTGIQLKNLTSVTVSSPVADLSIGVGANGTTDLWQPSGYRDYPVSFSVSVDIPLGIDLTYDFKYTVKRVFEQIRALSPTFWHNQDFNSPFLEQAPHKIWDVDQPNRQDSQVTVLNLDHCTGAFVTFTANNLNPPLPTPLPSAEIIFVQTGK